jgi:hypothetical protein
MAPQPHGQPWPRLIRCATAVPLPMSPPECRLQSRGAGSSHQSLGSDRSSPEVALADAAIVDRGVEEGGKRRREALPPP